MLLQHRKSIIHQTGERLGALVIADATLAQVQLLQPQAQSDIHRSGAVQILDQGETGILPALRNQTLLPAQLVRIAAIFR